MSEYNGLVSHEYNLTKVFTGFQQSHVCRGKSHMKRKVQFNNFIQQKKQNSFVTFIWNQSLFSGRLQKSYLSTNLTRIVKHLSTMNFSQRHSDLDD